MTPNVYFFIVIVYPAQYMEDSLLASRNIFLRTHFQDDASVHYPQTKVSNIYCVHKYISEVSS